MLPQLPTVAPITRILIRVSICAVPLCLLFNLSNTFAMDWFNHLWPMEYFGAYFAQHWCFPVVYNTNSLAGMTNTLFYAHGFYSFSGLLSIVLGSAVAFRLIALATLLLQFYHIERAVREVCGHPGYALLVAVMVTWATYPLTNLYSRSALTEFCGVACLYCSLSCLLVLLCRLNQGKKSIYDAISLGFFFLLVTFCHPLTAFYGAMCLAVIGAAGLIYLRSGWLALVFVINALCGLFALSSWLYSLSIFNNHILINSPLYLGRDYFWTADYGFSPLLEIFGLVPYDRNSIRFGADEGSGYLETQSMVPLLILVTGLVWIYLSTKPQAAEHESSEKSLCLALLPAALFVFCLSSIVIVCPFVSNYLGSLFHKLQFPYRIVNYVNLGIIAVTWTMLGLMKERLKSLPPGYVGALAVVIAISLTVCVTSAKDKLLHSYLLIDVNYYDIMTRKVWVPLTIPSTEWRPGIFRLGENIEELPRTFYGHIDYLVETGISKEKTNITRTEVAAFKAPQPSGPGTFGTTSPVTLDVSEPSWVVTNVCPFPWNKIIVDGKVAEPAQLTTPEYIDKKYPFFKGTGTCAVLVQPGKHVLEYRFEPDNAWKLLNIFSWITTLVWMMVWAGIIIAKRSDLEAYQRVPLFPPRQHAAGTGTPL